MRKENNYTIESKNDFLTGAYLVVSIPESDLDLNALHTIQTDCPDFILPFNYKISNCQVEFTYKVGSLCKLQYFYGDIPHGEYIEIWRSLLKPLLECGDWYMTPYSFVLDIDYLYYDKNNKTVAYVYVPSISGYSEHGAFNSMAIAIAKNITVSSPGLENKVLRSIVNDFNPGEFLEMLMQHRENEAKQDTVPTVGELAKDEVLKEIDKMFIEENSQTVHPPEKPSVENGGFRVFSGKTKKKTESKRNGYRNTVPVSLPGVEHQKIPKIIDVTQETKIIMSGAGFRCIGKTHLPQIIEVCVEEGGIFSIGRFDASVGKKQSSFEFERATKAVSRRHCVVEREGVIYRIVDLSSSAGTFINDKKIPPNTPFELTAGSRVSFGNLGADYIWETN